MWIYVYNSDSVDLGEGVSGPKAKKSRKSLLGPPGPGDPKVRKKSRKRSEKSPKTHFQTFWRLFGPFSRLFSDFWDPGTAPGDFFETFWLLAPRLLLPGPRNLKSIASFRGLFGGLKMS